MPAKASGSWARIATADRFCINVLGDDQEHVCRHFASQAENKFASVAHRASQFGLPVIDGSIAWIDCSPYAVHEAGDHLFVLGRVDALGIGDGANPLIFFKGSYGRYASFGE